MSDCVVNVRILWWHFQLTNYGRFRITFNEYLWNVRRWGSIAKPVAVCEWDWPRRNTSTQADAIAKAEEQAK